VKHSKDRYIIIFIKVTTNSSSNKLFEAKMSDDGSISLKACLTASPEKGKANASLIKLMSKDLEIKKMDIEILKGHASNKKVVKVSGASSKNLAGLYY
jgi:uncharacterized protein (TIGR00251 family)